MTLRVGDLIGDRYLLTRPIAVGGMGAVWSATDQVLGRTVAVKLLKPEYSSDRGFLERFRAEARHSAGLSHPNIAAVYDYGEAHDPTTHSGAYLVMELVPGSPLSAILDDRGRLPADEVLKILAQTASGLGAAHLKGIVHRDVKPANLLITPDDDVKITDFGIARAADQASLTATGTVMGTARYLSPEQATGEQTSPASDLYSLGVVGYEALAGRSPFAAESPVAQAMAHVHDQPRPLPGDVPRPVADLVMGLLNKDPKARPADGNALVQLVQRVQRGENVNLTQPHQAVAPPPTDATAVMGRNAPIAATAAMPSQASPTAVGSPTGPPPMYPSAQPQRRQRPRRTWTLPLIALIAIVGFIVAGVLWSQFSGPGAPDPDPTVTTTVTPTTVVTQTPTQTQPQTPTETTTPTEEPTTPAQTQEPDTPPVVPPPVPEVPDIPAPQPPADPGNGQGEDGEGSQGAGTQGQGADDQPADGRSQAQDAVDGGE